MDDKRVLITSGPMDLKTFANQIQAFGFRSAVNKLVISYIPVLLAQFKNNNAISSAISRRGDVTVWQQVGIECFKVKLL